MALVAKPYLIRGATMKTRGRAIMEITDPWYVTGLDVTTLGGAGALASAVTASGLPAPWTPHPIVTTCNLVSYSPEPTEGGQSAIVTLTYVNVQPQLLLRGGTSLVQTNSNIDRLGNDIFVGNYNPNATPPVSTALTKVVAGTYSWMRPQATLCVERIRVSPAYGGPDPSALMAFVGKTNSSTYFGFPKETMLCENVGFTNDEFGDVAYRYTMEFRIDPRGFNPRIAFRNPDTGQIGTQLRAAPGYSETAPGTPSDPAETQYGKKIVDRYEPVSFDLLFQS